MTDTNNTNGTEDDVNEAEVEASKSIDLRSLGIDPLSTPIADLVKLYRENHAIASDYLAKQKAGKDDPNDVSSIVKSNVKRITETKADSDPNSSQSKLAGQVAVLRTVGATITDTFFSTTPVTSGLIQSAVLLSELENLVAMARDEYQYHFNKSVQAMKDEKGIKSTPNEAAVTAKLTCVQLRNLIENRVNIAKMMGTESDIPSNLLKTEGVRKGFNTDTLPRVPRLEIGENAAQSPSTHLVFRFIAEGNPAGLNVDEDGVCTETTLNDVAHNVVSSGSYRWTGKEIAAKLQKIGVGLGATDTEWSLEFKTGTLYGKKA